MICQRQLFYASKLVRGITDLISAVTGVSGILGNKVLSSGFGMRCSGLTSSLTSLLFYIETFLQKFISYRVKWERGLRDIEEGRLTCGADFFKGRKFARIEMEKIKGQKSMDVVSQETEKDIK